MDRDEKWAVIAEQRRTVADLLAGLEASQWEQPSLCAEWRIRDVGAHLALAPQPPGIIHLLALGVRARGDFDTVNRDLAVAHADRPTAEIVTQLRELADSRRRPVITTLDNLLFDTLVHVQDIAVPLGLSATMPLEAAREGAERVWRMGWPFWARRRLRGLRLAAVDVDWAVGDGVEVRGPIRALLLLLTGRTAAALPDLDGPGVAQLAGSMREQAQRRGRTGRPA